MKRTSVIGLILVMAAQLAHAGEVTVVMEGVVTLENGGFPGSIGQPFTGSYTFEDTTPELFPGFYPGAVVQGTADFAGNSIVISDVGNPLNSLSLTDDVPDSYSVGAVGSGTLNGADVGEAGFAILLVDFTGTMISDTSITTIPAFVPPLNFATFQLLDVNGDPAVSATLTTLTVQATPLEVEINLKPGSNPSTVNLGSQGVAPLAIFGSADFDATQIDIDSLQINGDAASVAIVGQGNVLLSLEDLNDDGYVDAVVQFVTEGLALTDNAPLNLSGALLDATLFSGDQPADDPVMIVP